MVSAPKCRDNRWVWAAVELPPHRFGVLTRNVSKRRFSSKGEAAFIVISRATRTTQINTPDLIFIINPPQPRPPAGECLSPPLGGGRRGHFRNGNARMLVQNAEVESMGPATEIYVDDRRDEQDHQEPADIAE